MGREGRVVYREGNDLRCLRGDVVDDLASPYVVVHRRDGTISINRDAVIKIEV